MNNRGTWYYSSTQWAKQGGRNWKDYGNIHNYSEVTDAYTQDSFKSSNYIKRYMYEHLLYNGYNGTVETNDGSNILYRFNGIITSYDNGIAPIGTTVSDDTNLRFRYTTNYTYESGERGTVYVYLEKLSPADAIKQTATSVNNPTSENGFTEIAKSTTELPYAYNVRYTDLIGLMQSGYIYRLQIGFVVEDTTQDVLSLDRVKSVDVCTSEFFSLNNWKSSVISVKNIYQYAFPNDPDITQDNQESNSNGADLSNIEGGIGTIQNTTDNINNFLNEPNNKTSGDIESALNVDVDVTDPTEDFFTWFFEQLKNCFTVDTAQYLNFTILQKKFTINSDDYILDIPILKTVIGTGSAIFIFYGIFKDLRKEIEKVKEGKFEEIASEDITANMM